MLQGVRTTLVRWLANRAGQAPGPPTAVTRARERSPRFFEIVYPGDYWSGVDRTQAAEDPQSLFGDEVAVAWVIEQVRPETILEIGSWKGHSANFMASHARIVGLSSVAVCIDTFLGSSEHWIIPDLRAGLYVKNGRPTVLERFQGNTIARGNTDMVLPFPIDSANGTQVMLETDFRADLIFIDAAHSYEAVRQDIMRCWPLLTARGVMFGDDYQSEPLAQAVHDCAVDLGVEVLVYKRKWVFLDGRFPTDAFPTEAERRSSPEGWVFR